MNINELIKSTKGILNGKINLNKKIGKIKIDSRKIEPGDIFIAIKGENHDGNNYINEAINKEALLIISEKKLNTNKPYIMVNNTIKALGDIAHYMIKKYNPKVIAITGSVGKTTTKNLLYNILKNDYNIITNEKNYNNDIGVPLTVFNINEKTEILVIELGMNHEKEMSYLSKMVNPDIALITNIGSSHIGYLKTKENILKAKLEILDGMKEKTLFVNGDDPLLNNISDTYKSGFKEGNNLIGYDIKSNLYKSSFKITYKNKSYTINVNLPKHLLSDVILAINTSLYLNISINQIINSLKKYKSENMRMDISKDKNNNIIINDCYNSSFESLTGILKILKQETEEKLLILGDIKELGTKSKEIHQNLLPYIEDIKDKKVILVGPEMKNLKTNALYFDDYKNLLSYLKKENIQNKIILIKGSRSMKLENIADFFKEKL